MCFFTFNEVRFNHNLSYLMLNDVNWIELIVVDVFIGLF